ncbi:MAG: hypothetical protein WCF90_07940 [Methanomicrobiales archaeon]
MSKALDKGGEKHLFAQVSEVVCWENVWSVSGNEKIPRDYYIMISAGSLNATAIGRFTVLYFP